MKKLFITMALVLCAAAASAQVVAVAEEIVVEEQQPKRRGWAGYETNRFFDNWEITVAGGAQIMVSTARWEKTISDRRASTTSTGRPTSR